MLNSTYFSLKPLILGYPRSQGHLFQITWGIIPPSILSPSPSHFVLFPHPGGLTGLLSQLLLPPFVFSDLSYPRRPIFDPVPPLRPKGNISVLTADLSPCEQSPPKENARHTIASRTPPFFHTHVTGPLPQRLIPCTFSRVFPQ